MNKMEQLIMEEDYKKAIRREERTKYLKPLEEETEDEDREEKC
jgi:hypothetical protein